MTQHLSSTFIEYEINGGHNTAYFWSLEEAQVHLAFLEQLETFKLICKSW